MFSNMTDVAEIYGNPLPIHSSSPLKKHEKRHEVNTFVVCFFRPSLGMFLDANQPKNELQQEFYSNLLQH
jgi:hypothetical protein